MAEKNRLFTGARARFLLNGVKVGYASSVNGSEVIDYEGVRVLDNIQIEEHVPIAYDSTLECRFFRVIGETIKSRGWFPKTGTSVEEHLRNILTNGMLAASIEDSFTGKIAYAFEQVRLASNQFSIDARGVVGVSAQFVCIRAKDESES